MQGLGLGNRVQIMSINKGSRLTYSPMFCNVVHTNHGTICSCVGPVIDVQMKTKVFYREKCMISQMGAFANNAPYNQLTITPMGPRDVFFPSVYDALLVIRPSCNFRDGTHIEAPNQSPTTQAHLKYCTELPFHDSYLMGLIHLCCADYRSE
jgi:hypothetical protein